MMNNECGRITRGYTFSPFHLYTNKTNQQGGKNASILQKPDPGLPGHLRRADLLLQSPDETPDRAALREAQTHGEHPALRQDRRQPEGAGALGRLQERPQRLRGHPQPAHRQRGRDPAKLVRGIHPDDVAPRPGKPGDDRPGERHPRLHRTPRPPLPQRQTGGRGGAARAGERVRAAHAPDVVNGDAGKTVKG
jgi:hypothetical protein